MALNDWTTIMKVSNINRFGHLINVHVVHIFRQSHLVHSSRQTQQALWFDYLYIAIAYVCSALHADSFLPRAMGTKKNKNLDQL